MSSNFIQTADASVALRKGNSFRYTLKTGTSYDLNPKGRSGVATVHLVNARTSISSNFFGVVYLPNPEDVKFFARSSATLRCGGPADRFPGCVGFAAVTLETPSHPNKPPTHLSSTDIFFDFDYERILISYIQGGFKIGTPSELTAKRARIYGNWRFAILDVIFNVAKTSKISLIVYNNYSVDGRPFNLDFALFCTKKGYDPNISDVVFDVADTRHLIQKRIEAVLIDQS